MYQYSFDLFLCPFFNSISSILFKGIDFKSKEKNSFVLPTYLQRSGYLVHPISSWIQRKQNSMQHIACMQHGALPCTQSLQLRAKSRSLPGKKNFLPWVCWGWCFRRFGWLALPLALFPPWRWLPEAGYSIRRMRVRMSMDRTAHSRGVSKRSALGPTQLTAVGWLDSSQDKHHACRHRLKLWTPLAVKETAPAWDARSCLCLCHVEGAGGPRRADTAWWGPSVGLLCHLCSTARVVTVPRGRSCSGKRCTGPKTHVLGRFW